MFWLVNTYSSYPKFEVYIELYRGVRFPASTLDPISAVGCDEIKTEYKRPGILEEASPMVQRGSLLLVPYLRGSCSVRVEVLRSTYSSRILKQFENSKTQHFSSKPFFKQTKKPSAQLDSWNQRGCLDLGSIFALKRKTRILKYVTLRNFHILTSSCLSPTFPTRTSTPFLSI